MNINIDIFNRVHEYIKHVDSFDNEDDNLEFEAVLKMPIDSDQFRRIFNYLQTDKDKYTNDSLDYEVLDISTSSIPKYLRHRISIHGKQKILAYCKDNKLCNKVSEIIIKTKAKNYPTIKYESFDVNFNCSIEKKVTDDIDIICEEFNKNSKYFRYKKRYSFTTKNKTFRIDMTIVRKSKLSKIKFSESGVIGNSDLFEVEIEYLGNSLKSNSTDTTKELFQILAQLLGQIHKTDILLSKEEYDDIKVSYLDLIKSKVSKNQKQKEFIGPSPVTLEQENILENPSIGVTTILENYTVTDKTDGERMLLFVNKDKKIYFINSRMKFFDTGLKHEKILSLLDGEYVSKGINGDIKLFMCFDIYFDNGIDVSGNPFLVKDAGKPSELNREGLIKKFLSLETFKSTLKKSDLKIELKKFYKSDDTNSIFKYSKKILDDSKTFRYHIDGLIYTPAELPVGGYSKDSEKANMFGSWFRLFKWKPPEENTIDFLISINDSIINVEGTDYKLCSLFVGHNARTTIIDPIKILSDSNYTAISTYKPLKYKECLLPLENGNLYTKLTNEIIHNNSIVEFAFDSKDFTINIDETHRWIPRNIRHDKTELFSSTKSISRTANDIDIADRIWQTIIKPITQNVIIGIDKLNEDDVKESDDDVYYDRKVNRYNSLTLTMLSFHNKIIKDKCLYAKFKKGKSLLEIACGKGGDLRKWIYLNYKTVVGVDLSLDNIMNNNDGAYARFLDTKTKTRNKGTLPNIMFLKMDASQIWDKEYISSIEDNTSKDFANILWGHRNPSINYFKKFYELGSKEKFDLVSCQFAIHYFFENEATLDRFIENVDNSLKVGGYFFGTCLDGNLVDLALSSNDTIKGTQDGTLLWQIRKDYKEPFNRENPNYNFGKKIHVFVETINKEFPEYLVDFNLLKLKLQVKNITLLDKANMKHLGIVSDTSTELFSDIYDRERLTADETMNNADLKKYSFLNRYWIFQKTA